MQLCSRTSTDYYRGKSIMLDNISIAIDCNMQLMEAKCVTLERRCYCRYVLALLPAIIFAKINHQSIENTDTEDAS